MSEVIRVVGMKVIVKIPVQIYFRFLGRFTVESREYAVLNRRSIDATPPGDYIIEILCEADDAELLLERAKQLYPDVIPYIRSALDTVPKSF